MTLIAWLRMIMNRRILMLYERGYGRMAYKNITSVLVSEVIGSDFPL